MWGAQIEDVARTSLAVAYDRRGFGSTTTPDETFSPVNDLRQVHSAVSKEPAVLVGCSQGGRISLDYALKYPDSVAGLVLIAPGISGAPQWSLLTPAIEQLDAELEAALDRGDLARANELEAHFWLDGPLSDAGRVAGPARDLFLDMNGIALAHPDLTQEQSPEPAYDRVGEITVPTVVMWGDLDFADIDRQCRYLVEMTPNARDWLVSGAAHMVNLERPDAVNDAIRGLLDEL